MHGGYLICTFRSAQDYSYCNRLLSLIAALRPRNVYCIYVLKLYKCRVSMSCPDDSRANATRDDSVLDRGQSAVVSPVRSNVASTFFTFTYD